MVDFRVAKFLGLDDSSQVLVEHSVIVDQF